MNIYSLDGYDNYFYGYMAPSTGYISAFLVSAYQHGVVLQIPKKETDRGNRTIYTTAKNFSM